VSAIAPASDRDPPRTNLYRVLLRHAVVRLIFLYFVPLLLLTVFFHLQYRLVLKDIGRRHQQSLAEHQAGLLDMFLGDRLLNLTGLTGHSSLLLEARTADLEESLAELRRSSETFVDLAVLDDQGRVLGYAGPLPELKERNYRQEPWFVRLLAGESSHVITDVYPGFREQPHFTMAVKMEPAGRVRILRAVLSPEVPRAQLEALDPEPVPGRLADMATNIWLFSGAFCLIGGVVIWQQARWVARQQYQALQTERDLSRQLLQAAKLASVGELASGVAHEINNPLAVIAEKVGLVQDLMDPRFERELTTEDLKRHLASVEAAVYRCTNITRQLLGFVRQRGVELMACDVHDLLDKLLDRLLGPELEVADITVVRAYDQDLGTVKTDPGQLQQVVLNLLKNAADAITGPGTITITTRKRGDRFVVKVTDTGCGMTAEQLEKVFMPFFTTKEPGKGTGLGLSVSYGIIEGLGGRLSVNSEPGRGSEFTIDLPRGH
jgi:two-component system NtrC family sensor kinase